MKTNMRPRLVLLVLDGFCPRHCREVVSPNLVSIQRVGAYAPQGGCSVLPSSTYPNHASLVTGVEPIEHGIFANTTFTAKGMRPAQLVGAQGTTFLDAALAQGLRTGVVVGDPNIIGVVGGDRCEQHWPPGGVMPAGTPLVRGYAENATTFRELTRVLRDGADVVLCQLDNTDGISHLFGPDSAEAIDAHRAADRLVGELVELLRGDGRWLETILCVLSDHSQIPTRNDDPAIDLPRHLSEAGLVSEVIEEGSASLIRCGEIEECQSVVAAVEGVAKVGVFADRIVYAYAEPGRGFASRKPLSRGIHGGPETATTICCAIGGHPGLPSIGSLLAALVPTSASIAPLLMGSVGIDWDRAAHGVPYDSPL
jgi:predicted AlkP superfamily pyrophosphatase or phosphodiesterase